MPAQPMRVFISYDRSDGEDAGFVRRRLDEEGFQCFVAHDDIEMSEAWQARIWSELATCDCFVGLISTASAASAYCLQELAVALFRLPKERLVLAQLDETIPPGFAKWYQGVPLQKVLARFDEIPFIRENRVNAMIERLGGAESFADAKRLGRSLERQLDSLSEGQVRRLLYVGMKNSQVRDEGYGIGLRVAELLAEFREKHGDEETKRVLKGDSAPVDEASQ